MGRLGLGHKRDVHEPEPVMLGHQFAKARQTIVAKRSQLGLAPLLEQPLAKTLFQFLHRHGERRLGAMKMASRGMKATFRATGQTGILITGGGVPLDAVIADFMAGSIEYLTPDNDEDHWDLIEGQGSLFHASYSGVTMALVHGG